MARHAGHRLYGRRGPGEAIQVKDALRLSKAIDAAYGRDAMAVLLVPTTDEEWARASAASASLHVRHNVNVSIPGLNPPTLTPSNRGGTER